MKSTLYWLGWVISVQIWCAASFAAKDTVYEIACLINATIIFVSPLFFPQQFGKPSSHVCNDARCKAQNKNKPKHK